MNGGSSRPESKGQPFASRTSLTSAGSTLIANSSPTDPSKPRLRTIQSGWVPITFSSRATCSPKEFAASYADYERVGRVLRRDRPVYFSGLIATQAEPGDWNACPKDGRSRRLAGSNPARPRRFLRQNVDGADEGGSKDGCGSAYKGSGVPCSTTRSFWKNEIRSDRESASSWSWVTRTVVKPSCCCRWRILSRICSRRPASRLLSGSSIAASPATRRWPRQRDALLLSPIQLGTAQKCRLAAVAWPEE